MRDRLIEMLSKPIYPKIGADPAEVVADYLLDNGVIVPPCKVGDTVYVVDVADVKEHIKKRTVYGYEIGLVYAIKTMDTRWREYSYYFAQFGKSVFLTREEAERALKERE